METDDSKVTYFEGMRDSAHRAVELWLINDQILSETKQELVQNGPLRKSIKTDKNGNLMELINSQNETTRFKRINNNDK